MGEKQLINIPAPEVTRAKLITNGDEIMSKDVSFNLYAHITGKVKSEDYGGDPNELLDSIFPDGWEGEVLDVFTDPSFMPKGYVKVTDVDDD